MRDVQWLGSMRTLSTENPATIRSGLDEITKTITEDEERCHYERAGRSSISVQRLVLDTLRTRFGLWTVPFRSGRSTDRGWGFDGMAERTAEQGKRDVEVHFCVPDNAMRPWTRSIRERLRGEPSTQQPEHL